VIARLRYAVVAKVVRRAKPPPVGELSFAGRARLKTSVHDQIGLRTRRSRRQVEHQPNGVSHRGHFDRKIVFHVGPSCQANCVLLAYCPCRPDYSTKNEMGNMGALAITRSSSFITDHSASNLWRSGA